MLIKKDRLSHWYGLGITAWAVYFVFLGIPVFHLGLGVSLFKVGSFFALAGALQLAFTPWIFSAQPTSLNPAGKPVQAALTAGAWLLSTGTLLCCYVLYGKAIDSAYVKQRVLLIGCTALLYSVLSIPLLLAIFRQKKKSLRQPQAGTAADCPERDAQC